MVIADERGEVSSDRRDEKERREERFCRESTAITRGDAGAESKSYETRSTPVPHLRSILHLSFPRAELSSSRFERERGSAGGALKLGLC
jgi:hypothetical protein